MKTRTKLAALELQVLKTVRKFDMLRHGDHVLVAASGGADSTALLLCLHDLAPRLDLRLTTAHFNHGIRGAEADVDEEFARDLSSRLGWPFRSEAANLKSRAAAAKRNLEEMAREARYEFLRRVAAEVGAARVATGHNRNDQAETILFRLLRGSGLAGLSGIPAVAKGGIIRPLIECSRQQILGFLAARGAACREDSTNHCLHYQRNRIRHELVPYLEQHFNPKLVEALAREGDIARATHDFLERQAGIEFQRLRSSRPEGVALRASEVMQLHPALRLQVVRAALREALGSLRGIEAVHVEELLWLCGAGRSGRVVELPKGLLAWRDLDQLELGRRPDEAAVEFRYELVWPGRCFVPEAGMEFQATIQENSGSPGPLPDRTHDCALLDPSQLPPSLTIRSRHPGDRYGGDGHRKVKRMLLAGRIPLSERARLPMVAAGDAVVWVPGFRPARFFGAKPDSGRSVLIRAVRLSLERQPLAP